VAEDHTFVPVISGNSILCGSSSDDHVRCFDATSGALRWRFATDGPVRYAPALSQGVAFFGSDDGWIYAVRIVDGSLLWRHRPGPEDRRIPGNNRLISPWPIRSGLVVEQDTVFATAGLYPQQGAFACAFSVTNGAVLWQTPLEVSPEGYLLTTDNLLIVPTGRASPIGLDRRTGSFVRSFDTGGGTYAVAGQGEIFGGPGNAGSLAAVTTQSNQRLLTVPGRNLLVDGPRLHLLDHGRLKTVDRARQTLVLKRIRDLENQIRALQSSSKKTNAVTAPTERPQSNADELNRLSEALAQERRDLDGCELWNSACPEDLCAIAIQNAIITGGTNRVAAYNRATGQRIWDAPVFGNVLAIAATDQCLVVATTAGTLSVFRPSAGPPTFTENADEGSITVSAPSNETSPTIQSLVAAGMPSQGYALVAGIGSGQIIRQLLASSTLHVVAIDTQTNKTRSLRDQILAQGIYGHRLSAHTLPPGSLPFTDAFANVVLSESALEKLGPPAWPDAELDRVTRPFGGIRWTRADHPPTVRGPLEGAGEWTHQFANTANTASSQDLHIRSTLALQWFGGPGPDLMVDRHLRGPAPLASQGRLFVPGENLLVAVDAYNGTLLWQRDLPGSQRYTMPYDAGYMSLGSNHLAVAVRDACWLLDVTHGRTTHQWPVPRPSNAPTNLHWGYTALVGNRLFGTTQKATASRTIPGYEQIDVDYNNDQPLVTGLSIFQCDALTGGIAWHRQHGVILNTSITLRDQRLFFIEARDPERLSHPTGRIPLARLLSGDPWIVALDARSGTVVWETPLRGALSSSRNILYLTASPDKLVLLGSHRDDSNDTRYTIETRRTSDGTVLWTASHLARVPGEFTHGEQVHHPVILNDLLVAEPAVYELDSGRRLTEAGGVNPWNLVRPGHSCGTLSAAGDCLFFRAGNPTVMNLRANLTSSHPPTKLSPSRTGCWINMIPANGLLLIPEASAGCVCQFSLQTSMAFLPTKP